MFQALSKFIPLVALVTIVIQLQSSTIKTARRRADELDDDLSKGVDDIPFPTSVEGSTFSEPGDGQAEEVSDSKALRRTTDELHDLRVSRQRSTDKIQELQSSLQRAHEQLICLSGYAEGLEAEREDLRKRLWKDYDERVHKMTLGMLEEAAKRAGAQRINDRLKGDDHLSSRCDAVIAQHAALMERLVIEARALSQFPSSLLTGETTMYEIRAMTRMSLGRLQLLVAEATDVANN